VLGVGIGEEEPCSASNARALRERPRLSNPSVGKLRAGDDLQSPVRRGDCIDDAARGVGGAIVDDDHLKIGMTC
jgi:hypothetical protein